MEFACDIKINLCMTDYDDFERGVEALSAGSVSNAPNQRGNNVGETKITSRSSNYGANCVVAPWPGNLGGRRDGVQSGEIQWRGVKRTQWPWYVFPLRVGTPHMYWTKFRDAGGEGGAGHDSTTRLLSAFVFLHACSHLHPYGSPSAWCSLDSSPALDF